MMYIEKWNMNNFDSFSMLKIWNSTLYIINSILVILNSEYDISFKKKKIFIQIRVIFIKDRFGKNCYTYQWMKKN